MRGDGSHRAPTAGQASPRQAEGDQVALGKSRGVGPNQTLGACSLPRDSPAHTHQLSSTVTTAFSSEQHPRGVLK